MSLSGQRIAVLGGKNGLLGQALTRVLERAGATPFPLSREDCDILDPMSVEQWLDRHDPDTLINTAAYTQVDLAEDEPDKAFALNATAPPLLATMAARRSIPFVHYSTDFVFNGQKTTPYSEYDEPNAMSVYGVSKADGERGLLKLGYDKTLIIRISWLFGPDRTNFVKKILGLADAHPTLTVVNDQMGSPSYTPDIAENTVRLLEKKATGIYHLANSGETSWHGLANMAVNLSGKNCFVKPVPSSAYPTKAVRPPYSVLDLSKFTRTTGVTPRRWEDALKQYVLEDLGLGS
ncbi:dTDP-4-dehydrorhamnose reductase [Pseudodesulfovibrio indicus]|jgi:dTDP-4-dehydrorhamnose reductase|uniref:dTDP-4-dehydrorhamnose reductase n=1 Tax=Pseudodesulfovibrio indicus TaxID=1716143 RepID=A0A126QQ21_9BACT|nr:dTDP-4-dehydrorhamnose reductase [Pseudodesulfovibrio indicus]AMK11575.1 NAD(P)-dependent oxidoreductase [Pseudodesulfovibrio indicus]TDT89982.1 dTDP-4-dehydrorhamnose reductase [Pseudodesulfovibrio indicus]